MADYKTLTIDNSLVLDANGNIDKSTLGDFVSQVNAILKALQSSANNLVTVSKTIDSVTGLAKASFRISSSDYANVEATARRKFGELSSFYQAKKGYDPQFKATMSTEDTRMLYFTRKRKGTLAQRKAQEEVANLGGTYERTGDSAIKVGIPVSEKDFMAQVKLLGSERKAKTFFSKKLNDSMKESSKLSSKETAKEKQAKQEKQRKEDEKRLREENSQKLKSFFVIISIITVIADILRRILSATLQRASEIKNEAQKGYRYNVPYAEQLRYKRMERARGLAEGTTMSGIADIESKFGVTDKINDSDIQILEPVIGKDVAEAVRSGIGGKDPAELNKMILDKFFTQALKGINWNNQQVGVADASRSLIARLSLFSPAMADVLESMLYISQTEMYEGKVKDFDTFLDLGGVQFDSSPEGSLNRRVMEDLGLVVDELTAKFKSLKENVLDKLGVSLVKFVDWVNNSDLFLSDEEKAVRNEQNRKRNEEAYKKMVSLATGHMREAKAIAVKLGLDPDKLDDAFYLNQGETGRIASTAEGLKMRSLYALAKQEENLAEQAKEANTKTKIDYNSQDYLTPNIVKGVTSFLTENLYFDTSSVSGADVLRMYAKTYGNLSLEGLLKGEDGSNKDLIAYLAKKHKLGGWSHRTKQKNVLEAYNKGEITDSEIIEYMEENVLGVNPYAWLDKYKKVGLDKLRLEASFRAVADIKKKEIQDKLALSMARENALRSDETKSIVNQYGSAKVIETRADIPNKRVIVTLQLPDGTQKDVYTADYYGVYNEDAVDRSSFDITKEITNAQY